MAAARKVMAAVATAAVLGLPVLSSADAATFDREVAALAAAGARGEGSDAERAALELIAARATAWGVAPQIRDFSDAGFAHSFSRIVEVTIPGNSEGTLVIVVPLGGAQSAAQDVSIPFGLAMVDAAARAVPPVTVTVLFAGAERGPSADAYPLGSRLFLEHFQPTGPVAVVYVDLVEVPGRVALIGGTAGEVSPFWLIDGVSRALSSADLFFRVRGNETQLLRMGLQSTPQLEPYLQAGFPAVQLTSTGAEATDQEQELWPARVDRFLGALLASFGEGVPTEWDRHFLFFQVQGLFVPLRELTYLLLVLGVFAAAISLAFVFPERIRRYARAIRRNALRLLATAALLFGALWASGVMLQTLLSVRGLSTLWQVQPGLFFAGKVTLALMIAGGVLLAVRLQVARRILGPLTDRHPAPGYNTAAALTLLLVDIVVVGIVDISFSYYFVWAFAFTLLFSVSRSVWLKSLWLVVAPYWIVKTLVELLQLPAMRFAEAVLFSPVWGAAVGSIVLVPFVLMTQRVVAMLPHRGRRRWATEVGRRVLVSGTLALTILSVAGVLSVWLYRPYGPRVPQPVTARAVVDAADGKARVELRSPAPLGPMMVSLGAVEIAVDTSRNAHIATPTRAGPATREPLVEVTQESVAFLRRQVVAITLQPKGNASRIGLQLVGPADFVLFDSNFPFQRQNARSYTVLVGRDPPSPLRVELTLPADTEFALRYQVSFASPPLPLVVRAEDDRTLSVDGSVTVAGVAEIRT